MACDDGNVIKGDGCDDVCAIEAGWKCGGGTPSTPDSCVRLANVTVNVSGNYPGTYPGIYITFSDAVKVLDIWSNVIAITNLKTFDAFSNFSATNKTNASYFIDMSYYQYTGWQEPFQVDIALPKYIIDKNSTIVAFGYHKVVVDYTFYPPKVTDWRDVVWVIVRIALMFPMFYAMVSGHKYLAWMGLESLQTLSMVMFLNVPYPDIMYTIMDVLAVVNFRWFPNPFSFFKYDIYVPGRTPPVKFQMYHVSGLFLHNSGQLLVFYGSALLISQFLKKLNKSYGHKEIVGKLNAVFDGTQLKRLWVSLYVFFALGVFLHVSHLQFVLLMEYISTIVALSTGVVLLVTFILLYSPKIKSAAQSKVKNYKPGQAKKLSSEDALGFFAEFKNVEVGIGYVSFLTLLKLGYAAMMCFVSDSAIVQLSMALVIRALALSAAAVFRPYQKLKDSIYIIVLESLIILVIASKILDKLGYDQTGEFSTFAYVSLAFMFLHIAIVFIYSIIQMFIKRPAQTDFIKQGIVVPTTYQRAPLNRTRKMQIIQKSRLQQ